MDYGETGTKKSTFAATWPKPMIVFAFDPHGKDMPYWKGAQDVGELQSYSLGDTYIIYRDVIHADGVIRIEYYHDHDVEHAAAYSTFLGRMSIFHTEYANWATCVTDSITFMELVSRKNNERMNPMQKFAKGTDIRQWFAGSTDDLENMLVIRYASMPMNTLIICHESKEMSQMSGEMLKGPAAPGRLSKKQVLNCAYQEQYRSFTHRGEDGVLQYYLQTQNRDGFIAASQIGAPDPVYPHYESLWENWGK
jgi:hypothetical protein